MSKNYKQLLPVNEKMMIKDQFGQLPLSIMEFTNPSKWECAYFEQDESEKRRSDDAEYLSGLGMSEFSSAVCEFILKYWSMKNSIVVDPFSGRATRAVISEKLGRKYYGYEISPLTYNRSIEHFKKVNVSPTLYMDDGCELQKTPNEFAHLVMTCPPYWNLEKYEVAYGQLSNCSSYESFYVNILRCANNINRVLKPGGFVCWVCADWRDNTGFKHFSNDCINIFWKSGLIHHDTVIIKNNSPFAALQSYKCACKRITAKTHETLLVFKKDGQLDLNGLESDVDETSLKFFEL